MLVSRKQWFVATCFKNRWLSFVVLLFNKVFFFFVQQGVVQQGTTLLVVPLLVVSCAVVSSVVGSSAVVNSVVGSSVKKKCSWRKEKKRKEKKRKKKKRNGVVRCLFQEPLFFYRRIQRKEKNCLFQENKCLFQWFVSEQKNRTACFKNSKNSTISFLLS